MIDVKEFCLKLNFFHSTVLPEPFLAFLLFFSLCVSVCVFFILFLFVVSPKWVLLTSE